MIKIYTNWTNFSEDLYKLLFWINNHLYASYLFHLQKKLKTKYVYIMYFINLCATVWVCSAVELCRCISNYTSDETKINTKYTLYPIMGYWIEKVNIERIRE